MHINNKAFRIKDFEIRLTQDSTTLEIHAENLIDSKNYAYKITNESVFQVTNGLFSDLPTLYQGLYDGLEGKHKGIKVSISINARIEFFCETYVGTVKREFSFNIQLEEALIEPSIRMERQLAKLSRKLLALETDIPVSIESNQAKINQELKEIRDSQ